MLNQLSLLGPLCFFLVVVPTTLAAPSVPALSSRPPTVPLPVSSFQPRTLHFNDLHPLYFDTIHTISPAVPAARALESFYSEFLTYLQLHSADLPIVPEIAFSYGDFELGIFAGGGIVEWDFVYSFAFKMLMFARLGYAGTYATTWSNSHRTKAYSMMLRLRI